MTTLPMIATVEEIRSIAQRAIAVLEAMPGLFDDEPAPAEEHRRNLAFEAATEALRFCARAAAQLGDARLVPVLAEAFDQLAEWDDYAHRNTETVADGLANLLRAGAPATSDVEELAEHESATIRAAIARGLRPADARAIAVLEQLALDPDAGVRKPARESLAKTREVPWWHGKFDADPLDRLTPEEAARLKGTLEKLSALLDEPRLRLLDKDAELARLAGALPDALAVEVARIALAPGGRWGQDLTALGAMMVAREGGIEALIEVCEHWAGLRHFHLDDAQVQMVARAPAEVRLRACLALARWAAAQPPSDRDDWDGAPGIAAEIAGRAFPPGADPAPLLDLILTVEPEDGRGDRVTIGLSRAFTVEGIDTTNVADRLLEARLAGFPGRWRSLHNVEPALDRLPRDVLRRAAEEAIRRDHADTVRWGIQKLLFTVHDPDRDPPPIDLVRRFWEDPRTREALLLRHDVSRAAVSFLRAALRREDLEPLHAAITTRVVEELWPTPKGEPDGGPHEESPSQKKARSDREQYAAFLGPAELHGPVTEEEWAALRRLRERFHGGPPIDWMLMLGAIPDGPWHPDDWAFIERAAARVEEGDGTPYFVAMAIQARPRPEALPLLERLVEAADADDRGPIRRAIHEVRARLGMEDEEEEEEDEGPAPAREWMDEDDE